MDAKRLLQYMGVPVFEAPTEAEAQCAELVKKGAAFGVASEDMDSLTFAANFLLRGFNSKKEPITEISYYETIRGLDLTEQEFIDMCILCGCDYTDHIEGVGPTTALKLISEHSTIENVITHLTSSATKKTHKIPENFNYQGARDLFMNPDVVDATGLTFSWGCINEELLKSFMVTDKGFAENRVLSGIKRMQASSGKAQ
jgi:flap endonuclease-1